MPYTEKRTHVLSLLLSKDADPHDCPTFEPAIWQLEAAQRQHADLCKLVIAKVVTLHTILLGVGGTCYTHHTLN
eukprot:1144132-Pelagomonas_calceolata.AAC.4